MMLHSIYELVFAMPYLVSNIKDYGLVIDICVQPPNYTSS